MTVESTADLCWTAEQLYDDLKRAGFYVEAASVFDALTDLRRKAREEREDA